MHEPAQGKLLRPNLSGALTGRSRHSGDGGAAELGRLLERGAVQLGVELSVSQRDTLLAYLDLLARWNRVYNLTGVREPVEMVTRHLLDSLAVLPHVRGERLLDVGTGAGLPGLVLAVARPGISCVLLDSSRKKTRFCVHAAGELALANVWVVRSRLEDYHPRETYSTVIARAYSRATDWLQQAPRLTAPGGRVLAMKGIEPGADEVAGMPECAKVMSLSVPGLDAARHLLVLDADCMKRSRQSG